MTECSSPKLAAPARNMRKRRIGKLERGGQNILRLELGLLIGKQIVALHSRAVWVKKTFGEGGFLLVPAFQASKGPIKDNDDFLSTSHPVSSRMARVIADFLSNFTPDLLR